MTHEVTEVVEIQEEIFMVETTTIGAEIDTVLEEIPVHQDLKE